jgi:hypothetical protein
MLRGYKTLDPPACGAPFEPDVIFGRFCTPGGPRRTIGATKSARQMVARRSQPRGRRTVA